MVMLIASYLKPAPKLSLDEEYDLCFQILKKEMMKAVDKFVEVRSNITYTLRDEKLKFIVKEIDFNDHENEILMLNCMDCIDAINVYEIFNNNIHLLNRLYITLANRTNLGPPNFQRGAGSAIYTRSVGAD